MSESASRTRLLGQYKELIVQRRGLHILQIALNRPEQKNTLNRRSCYELIRALDVAKQDANITVVVLTGVGDTFTAGSDFAEFDQSEDRLYFKRVTQTVLLLLMRAFIFCPKVLVSLVHGGSHGVGVALNALCDIVYCTESAFFEVPFTQLGLCPEGGSSYILPALMGRFKASEFLLFGTRITAQQALQSNLVARVFKPEHLESHFWPLIMQQATLPAHVLRITKRLLQRVEREAVLSAIQAEAKEFNKLVVSEFHLKAIQESLDHKDFQSKL